MNALATPSALSEASTTPARISRTAATALAIALVAVIAWLDYVTGDFSLAVFYLAPVAVATWYASTKLKWRVVEPPIQPLEIGNAITTPPGSFGPRSARARVLPPRSLKRGSPHQFLSGTAKSYDRAMAA